MEKGIAAFLAIIQILKNNGMVFQFSEGEKTSVHLYKGKQDFPVGFAPCSTR